LTAHEVDFFACKAGERRNTGSISSEPNTAGGKISPCAAHGILIVLGSEYEQKTLVENLRTMFDYIANTDEVCTKL